jgi:hypothetical protein
MGSKVYSLDFKSDSSLLIAGTSNNRIYYEPIASTAGRMSINQFQQILTVSYSKDGTFYASGGTSNIAYIYNPNNTSNYNKSDSQDTLTSSVFSYDGSYLLFGDSVGALFLYKKGCFDCQSGTYFNTTLCRKCDLDILGCRMCINSTFCQACQGDYYLDTTTKLCKLCLLAITQCTSCNSSSICTSCLPTYYLESINNNCTSCWSKMKGCILCKV